MTDYQPFKLTHLLTVRNRIYITNTPTRKYLLIHSKELTLKKTL